MITTTEFFLFFAWALTLAYAFHERNESRKIKRILIEFIENEALRDHILREFQLFKKSIIKA